MRKLVVWNVMTLDGYFEGARPWDLDFHQTVWGDELEAFAEQQLGEVGTLLFGRKTYEGMAGYWANTSDEGQTAPMMNAVPKAVISNTLSEAGWNNTRLLSGRAEDAVRALKAEDGKDVYLFGSAELLDSLLKAKLVDEIRLCIAPVVLGQGSPLFKRSEAQLGLRVKSARPLQTGGLLVFYEPKAD
jgi:dihydrofolate reductase